MKSGSRNQGKSNQQFVHFCKKLFNHSIKFFLLFLLIALFSGYERSNPKTGESLVDFYLEQTTREIKTQATILLLNIDSIGYFEGYVNDITYQFYNIREFRPVWTYNYKATPFFNTLSNFLDSLDFYGIPSENLNSESLGKLYAKMSKFKDDKGLTHRIALEMHTTRQLFKAMLYLNRGIFTYDTSNAIRNLVADLPVKASLAIANNSLTRFMQENQPEILPYQNLIKAMPGLITAKRLASSIGIDTFRLNDDLLAKSLYYIGYLPEPKFDSLCTKETTLTKLQKAYSLEDKGTLNPETFAQLTNLIEMRFNTVCLNVDRLRKLEHEGKDFLFVNIPSYRLAVIKDKQKMLDFNVVVGKKRTPTPVLSSKIYKVVTNPYWTVPRSISRYELLHRIRKDSNFLSENGYAIINNSQEEVHESMINWEDNDPLGNDYWIRQKNGNGNALGQVKFMFHNDFRIYLHDTPSKKLFKRDCRAYSHGCIRLENPDKLAQYIFDNYYSQKDKLSFKSLVKSRKRKEVHLPEQILIHIQYLTCMGNENGELEFYPDVYNRDETGLTALFRSEKHDI